MSHVFDINNFSYKHYEIFPHKINHQDYKKTVKDWLYMTQNDLICILDTETTGFPRKKDYTNLKAYDTARTVQISWMLFDRSGIKVRQRNYIIKPDNFRIPYFVTKIHGITNKKANDEGVSIHHALKFLFKDLKRTRFFVGHNINFDLNVLKSECFRYKKKKLLNY